jgi:hypothetical protein
MDAIVSQPSARPEKPNPLGLRHEKHKKIEYSHSKGKANAGGLIYRSWCSFAAAPLAVKHVRTDSHTPFSRRFLFQPQIVQHGG